ncbi:TniQ family protein [Pseudomonas viridiflava]|uniref:TniQ family protein n=1 Tax=Pseudomonas viridiflava TaxID=33069 RepID=UPI000F06EB06|nr:TniQ family protein [Pseudomonas viridiflava]
MSDVIFIPFPLPEESPTSVLKRFAVHHGCEIPAQLCTITRNISFKASTLSREAPLVQWIAQRAGNYSARFLDGFYKPIGPLRENMPFEIHGTLVPSRLIRSTGTGYCSECWSEGCEHSIKDFKFSLNCPYHHRRYLFACPHCEKRLWWTDPLRNRCSCQGELISEPCTLVDTGPEEFTLKCLRAKNSLAMENLKNTLTQLQYKMNARPDDLQNRLILKTAICIITDDKAGVEDYLMRIHGCHPDLPADVISAKLALVKHPFARRIMKDFSNINYCPLPTASLEGAEYPFTLRRIQVREASSVSSRIFRRLADDLGIRWPKLDRKTDLSKDHFLPLLKYAWAWKKDAKNFETDINEYIELESARELIGVTLFYLKKLIRAGYLNAESKPNQNLRIRRDELTDFLKKYESVNSVARRLQLSSRATRFFLRRQRVPYIEVLKSKTPTVFIRTDTDRIVKLHNTAPALCRKRFDRKQLKLVDADEENLYITCASAAKRLGLQHNTVREYAKAGVFSAKRSNTCMLVPIQEVETFSQKFIPACEYAKLLDIPATSATQALIDAGFKPAAEWRLNNCHSPLFYRADIENQTERYAQNNQMTVSIREAKDKLSLPSSTIINLIKLGDLASDGITNSILRASAKKVALFYTTHANALTISEWCNLPARSIQNSLRTFDINPICGPLIDGCRELLYRVADLDRFGVKPHSGPKPKYLMVQPYKLTYRPTLLPLIAETEIQKKYHISKAGITRFFVQTGYINVFPVGKVRYMTASDAKKIAHILNKYYTPGMVDAMLNTHSFAAALCRQGKLKTAQKLPQELTGRILITKQSVNKLIAGLPKRPP